MIRGVIGPKMTRAFTFVAAFLLAGAAHAAAAQAADPVYFWDLQPKSLRLLVASPQVMVTRTETGWDSYCRCPVVLSPAEVPQVMKKAIVATEDKRYFDHSGVDVVSLLSVLKGGLTRGGSTIPMQLLKNLVFHDLRASDVLTRLERKGAEVWYAGLFDEAVGKEELLAAYLNQIEFGGRDIVGLYRASRHYFRKEPKDLTLYEAALLAGMVKAGAVPLQYDAGAVMMTPNRRVQPMVGSVNWAQRQFNNAVKARVQAGSTAKLPLLVAACEAGKTPESRVMDQPVKGNWPSNGALG